MLEAALTLAFIALCIHLIPRMPVFRIEGVRVELMMGLFVLKLLAGLSLVWIYTVIYPDRAYADIFRYFDDSAVIASSLSSHPWDFFRMLTGIDGASTELAGYYDRMHNWYNTELVFRDTRTMIRFSALLRVFTLSTYFPQVVVICFLSTVGLAGMFRYMRSLAPGRDLALLVLLFMTPSILLWTSGLIKEAFLFYAMGLLLFQVERWQDRTGKPVLRMLAVLLAIFVLLTIKAYVFFLFAPVLFAPRIASFFSTEKQRRVSAMVYIVWLLLLAGMAPALTGTSIPELLAAKRDEFIRLATQVKAGSIIELDPMEPGWLGLLVECPMALFRAFVYPMPNQVSGLLGLMSALENGFVLLFIFWTLTKARHSGSRPLAAACIGLCFALSLLLLASLVTPVIGALVRYKVPALPFLLFFFVSYIKSGVLDLPERFKAQVIR